MSRIHEVIHRYNTSRALIRRGVDIFSIGDPPGASLNGAVRRALYETGDDDSEVWDQLLRAASALRWRRMTQPQPNAHNPSLTEAIAGVLAEVNLLRGIVGDESLLDQIAATATAVGEADSPVGEVLLRSVQEVGTELCVVVASNGSARAGLAEWLGPFAVKVALPSELGDLPPEVEQSYVVGPPTFFPASLVTAPAMEAVTFVMPTWFADLSVPRSSFAALVAGGIEIRAKIYKIGDLTESEFVGPESEIEENYYPQPVWGRRMSEGREPEGDEVEACKLLLNGGLALWLDDGERIRSLDPRQPEGERVSYEPVNAVRAGTYLVLREGATERGAMYDAAIAVAGDRAASIMETQERWKRALADRLTQDGEKRVTAELKFRNVRSVAQVRAWTEPTLICPKHEEDFAALLEWLGLPIMPFQTNAISLRRALYRATADLRLELEDAAGKASMLALERDGFMRLELQREGFRGMLVARVAARAPFTEFVSQHQIRVPFPDGGAQWLE